MHTGFELLDEDGAKFRLRQREEPALSQPVRYNK
jgi:hypothetical protein